MGSSGRGAIGTGSQSGRCLAALRHPSSKRSIITRLNILCRGAAPWSVRCWIGSWGLKSHEVECHTSS